MNQNVVSELTNEELEIEAKKKKSDSIMNAVFIGLLIGIIIYSSAKNGFAFVTLIPLFIAYKLIKSSKNKDDLGKFKNTSS